MADKKHYYDLTEAIEIIERLKAERDQLRAELEESDAVLDKLAKLLAGVAVALKGEELPLHRHSYHDLPEGVQALKAELERVRAQNESFAEHMRALAYRLGAGGYNAPEVNPDIFASKINGGIDMLVDPLVAELERARAALCDVTQTLRWQAFGECRGVSETLLSPKEASEKAMEALGKGGRADG